MINRPLSYIVISDVHLGHRRNKTRDIIHNLDLFFQNYKPPLEPLDYLFIAGDLFDQLLDFGSEQIHEISIWMSRLMAYCLENKIKLRILEGTPSHDWMQSTMFDTIASIVDFKKLNYRYVKTLDIEVDVENNLSILYVPDEWHPNTMQTYREVVELMHRKKLQKIDIAIMHGQFTYQLPQAAIKAPRHDEQLYLDIVEHFIHIGHVHQFSSFERIIAEGSFDRLTHGDEVPKGGIYARIFPEQKQDVFHFIENKTAKVFKTIQIPDKAFENIFEYLNKKIGSLPKDSHIRLKTKSKDKLNAIYPDLIRGYLDYNLSKDVTGQDDAVLQNILDSEMDMTTYSPIDIKPQNIEELLLEQIKKKYSAQTVDTLVCQRELQALL
jgi:hypothetical protein